MKRLLLFVLVILGASRWGADSAEAEPSRRPCAQVSSGGLRGDVDRILRGKDLADASSSSCKPIACQVSIQRPRNLQFNDQGEIKSVSDDQSTESCKMRRSIQTVSC